YFSRRKSTVLLLDDRTSEGADLQVRSIAHGVIALEQTAPAYGAERRQLNVVKIRGIRYRGGHHDYIINTGGIKVFPRLVASEHYLEFKRESISSGIPALDKLLDGGLDRGTSNLIMGPPGTGKSTLALQFSLMAAARGEHVMLNTFDENLGTLVSRATELGFDVSK